MNFPASCGLSLVEGTLASPKKTLYIPCADHFLALHTEECIMFSAKQMWLYLSSLLINRFHSCRLQALQTFSSRHEKPSGHYPVTQGILRLTLVLLKSKADHALIPV